MGFGVSVRVAPGVRLRASSRGVRASVGPRAARVHVGSGRAGFSTGVGPVTYYTSVGESQTKRSGAPHQRSRPTLAQLDSQAGTADKAEQIQQVLLAEHALRTQHVVGFPKIERPFAPDAQPIDVDSIESDFRRQAMANIGWFARERRELARREARQAAVAIANEQFTKALDEAERLQSAYDAYWDALCAHELETVVGAVDDAFADNAWDSTCVDAGTDENSGHRYVGCVVAFGPAEMVPDRTVATTPTGRPSLRKRSKTDINNVYVAALGSTVLATVKEALAVSPATDEVWMLVVRAEASPRVAVRTTGYSAIYFGVFERSEMDTLNWQAIDPEEQLLRASGAELVRKGVARTVVPLGEDTQSRMAEVLRAFSEPENEQWHPGD